MSDFKFDFAVGSECCEEQDGQAKANQEPSGREQGNAVDPGSGSGSGFAKEAKGGGQPGLDPPAKRKKTELVPSLAEADHLLIATRELKKLALRRVGMQWSVSLSDSEPKSNEVEHVRIALPAQASPCSCSVPSSCSCSQKPPAELRLFKARYLGCDGESALTKLVRSTDLQPEVYEGGFKLWECARDLVAYLAAELGAAGLQGKRVAELGCGHGLPGVWCAKQGAQLVVFQDLNQEVLINCTAVACRLNLASLQTEREGKAKDIVSGSIRFVCGHWRDAALATLMGRGEFDLVLSSDTLYSQQSMQHLLHVVSTLLAPQGKALIAAKRYYFGVGGSTGDFMRMVREQQAPLGLRARVVQEIEDGQSNLREVLELRRL